jgi:phage gp36-like protein
MMSYTSPEKIKGIMRKLPNSVTDQDIQQHIDKADALIDSYLGEVYSTPFNPVPKLIENISTDLSIFFLAESLFSSNQPNLDEYQGKRYERSIKLLEMIIAGELSLGRNNPPLSGRGSNMASTHEDIDPIFSYDEPEW